MWKVKKSKPSNYIRTKTTKIINENLKTKYPNYNETKIILWGLKK